MLKIRKIKNIFSIKKSNTILINSKLISQIILLAIVLVLTKDMWLGKGYIIFTDLDFGMNDKTYIQRIFGLFNSMFSSMNFFNLSRLAFITPLYLMSFIFSNFIPAFLLRSIILVSLVISAIGMYCLCEKLLKSYFGNFIEKYHYYGLIIPALYYTINPWVIFRIQHIFLLPGYACYPWVLYNFIDLFREKDEEESNENVSINKFFFSRKKLTITRSIFKDLILSIKIAIFICIGSAGIHYFFFYILTIVLLSLAIFTRRLICEKKVGFLIKIFFVKHIMVWGITFLINAYWLIPYIIAMFATTIEPNNVNVIESLAMFSRFSNLKNIIYLISYWWPMFDTNKYLNVYFWIGGGIFIVLIIYIVVYRFYRCFGIRIFTICVIFMIMIAMGVNGGSIFGAFYIFVVTKIPIFGQIFRDPNKIIGPMACFAAIFIGFAVDRVLFLIKREHFGVKTQFLFLIFIIVGHYYYYEPFKIIFSQGYYSGSDIPQEYKDVNENHNPKDGKVLWMPSMDNMLNENQITNYNWNKIENGEDLGLNKTVSDFHFFSSSKQGIFQHENNDGMVLYLYSFLQDLLDKTGAQHFDKLISWTGFNEFAFHNDIYDQGDRIEFNKKVLDEQKGLTPYYNNKIFTLYNVEKNQENEFGINRIAYLSKGLFSFLYMMDETDRLNITPQNTGITWSQLKKQNVNIGTSDIMVGDNKLDFAMPYIDNKYVTYPFDLINTGDPHTKWGKTLTMTPDWNFILKSNNVKNYDYDYDYSHGIVYTNVSNKLDIPIYNFNGSIGEEILSTKDILNDFFKADNSDIFSLTVFPEINSADEVLYGNVSNGYSGNNTWQVAKSKIMDMSKYAGKFLRIQSVVSGVNAGTVNYKVRFFDGMNNEIGVSYISKSDNMAEYEKTNISENIYVPQECKNMRIDILTTMDIASHVYFWIHDFRIYDISKNIKENDIKIPIKQKSKSDEYRVFIRAYMSNASKNITIRGESTEKNINLNSVQSSFKWIDVGNVKIGKNGLDLVPSDGLTIINQVDIIPIEDSDNVINEGLKKLNGIQMDFSIANEDYDVESNFPIRNMEEVRVFPNTINSSITPIDKGEMHKTIDIINSGNYNLSITGNIGVGKEIIAEISNEAGVKVLDITKKEDDFANGGQVLSRNFQGTHYTPVKQENKYFLDMQKDISTEWLIKKYELPTVHLEPGKYTITIKANSKEENMLNRDEAHFLGYNEVIIPDQLRDKDKEILQSFPSTQYLNITKSYNKEDIVLKNNSIQSDLWIIYTLNKILVKKGQILGVRVKINSNGLKDISGKLLWTDQNSILKTSSYMSYDETNNEFYILIEAPIDGFVQPCFFSKSDGVNEGTFSIKTSEGYIVDNFIKIEGTSLIPDSIEKVEDNGEVEKSASGEINIKNSKYFVFNEAFNPIWRFWGEHSEQPQTINFIHNSFPIHSNKETGRVVILPILTISYYIGLAISIISLIQGIFIIIKNKHI